MGETVIALGETDEDTEDQGDVGARGAERGAVRQVCYWDVLGFASADKVDVCYEEGDPSEEPEDGDEVDEVAENGFGVVGDVHVGDAGDAGAEDERVDGDAAAVGLGEEFGGLAFFGEAVDGPGCDVEV